MTVEELVSEMETMHYEVSTETRLVRVGLKEEQNLTAILEKFPRLSDRKTLDLVRNWQKEPRDEMKSERLSRIYFHCLGRVLHKELVQFDDEIHTFLSKAKVKVDDEEISYYEIYPRLNKEEDFQKRERLGEAMGSVHKRGNPLLRQILERELAILEKEFGFAGYTAYCASKKRLDYEALAKIFRDSLVRTRGVYEKEMGSLVETVLKRRLKEVKRFHIFQLSKMERFDPLFSKEALLKRMEESLSQCGIALSNYPNIHLDLEERPRKNPRACCFTAKVPQEIHLIMKPMGGLKDYETFLHEAGHALHYGSTDSSLPYEFRELGRSYALSETYAFLLQNLTLSVAWLTQAMGLKENEALAIRRTRLLNDLFMYRRYSAKFLAELEFFKRKDLEDHSIYALTLTEVTGFLYEPSNYLFDMDSEFYSVDYLRAWLAEAQLAHCMESRWGKNWFSNEKAGHFLIQLWQRGESLELESLVQELGYQPFDPSFLEQRFAELETNRPLSS